MKAHEIEDGEALALDGEWRERVRNLLGDRGISARSASTMIGRSPSFVSDLLAGHDPGVSGFAALARIFGVSLDYLLFGDLADVRPSGRVRRSPVLLGADRIASDEMLIRAYLDASHKNLANPCIQNAVALVDARNELAAALGLNQ